MPHHLSTGPGSPPLLGLLHGWLLLDAQAVSDQAASEQAASEQAASEQAVSEQASAHDPDAEEEEEEEEAAQRTVDVIGPDGSVTTEVLC